jgi:hypothetical protein
MTFPASNLFPVKFNGVRLWPTVFNKLLMISFSIVISRSCHEEHRHGHGSTVHFFFAVHIHNMRATLPVVEVVTFGETIQSVTLKKWPWYGAGFQQPSPLSSQAAMDSKSLKTAQSQHHV